MPRRGDGTNCYDLLSSDNKRVGGITTPADVSLIVSQGGHIANRDSFK